MIGILGVLLASLSLTLAANTRINNAEEATLGQFSSIAYLKQDQTFLCGSVLISETRALTAYSCVAGRDYKTFSVVAAAVSRDDNGGIVFNVDGVISRSAANAVNNGLYNLAILSISATSQSDTGRTAAPAEINMYSTAATNANALVTIAGWGETTALLPKDSEILRFATGNFYLPYSQCGFQDAVPDDIVCTTPAGPSICPGDIGGPLYAGDGSTNTLLGIGVKASSCDGYSEPGLFIDVTTPEVYEFINMHCGLCLD